MDKGTAYRMGQADAAKGRAPNPQKVPSYVMGNYEAGYQDETEKQNAKPVTA